MFRAVSFAVVLGFGLRSSAQTPMHEVNRCVTAPQLEQVLSRLSKAKDEPSKAALLWGSILFDGFKKKSAQYPNWLLQAGRKAAFDDNVGSGTKSLQLWWLSTVGDQYLPPDFRNSVIDRWETVMYNGKPMRVPIERPTEEDAKDKRTRLLMAELEKVKVRQEEHVIALAWQRKPTMPVPDAEVAAIANRRGSPWQAVAVGEMSLRERLRGENGPWSAQWDRIVKGVRPLAVDAMLTEHRERLAKRKKG